MFIWQRFAAERTRQRNACSLRECLTYPGTHRGRKVRHAAVVKEFQNTQYHVKVVYCQFFRSLELYVSLHKSLVLRYGCFDIPILPESHQRRAQVNEESLL